jgi:hypothetical protein
VDGFDVGRTSSEEGAEEFGVEDSVGNDKDVRGLIAVLALGFTDDGFEKGGNADSRREGGRLISGRAGESDVYLVNSRLVRPIPDVV